MPDREKVIKDNAIHGLQSAIEISGALVHLRKEHAIAILALLKEHENQKQNWLKQIADTQYLNAPGDWQNEDQKLYSHGVYDGLQIAWDIISEGR